MIFASTACPDTGWLGLLDVASLVQGKAIIVRDALLQVLVVSSNELVQERVDLGVELRINLVADVDGEDDEFLHASGAAE